MKPMDDGLQALIMAYIDIQFDAFRETVDEAHHEGARSGREVFQNKSFSELAKSLFIDKSSVIEPVYMSED